MLAVAEWSEERGQEQSKEKTMRWLAQGKRALLMARSCLSCLKRRKRVSVGIVFFRMSRFENGSWSWSCNPWRMCYRVSSLLFQLGSLTQRQQKTAGRIMSQTAWEVSSLALVFWDELMGSNVQQNKQEMEDYLKICWCSTCVHETETCFYQPLSLNVPPTPLPSAGVSSHSNQQGAPWVADL